MVSILGQTSNKEASNPKEVSAKPTKAQEVAPFEFITRIKLDVTVNAPLIVVPHPLGDEALQLDCGLLYVSTTFEALTDYYGLTSIKTLHDRCTIPPLIEIQKISLNDMQIAR